MKPPDLHTRVPSVFFGVIGMGAHRVEHPVPARLPDGFRSLQNLPEIRLYDDDAPPPSVVIVNANVR